MNDDIDLNDPLPGTENRGEPHPTQQRDSSMEIRGRFRKGVSGNPGGRPRDKEVRELARLHGPRAVKRLAELMQSANERVAVSACAALLDRGYGRPDVHVTGNSAPLVSISLAPGQTMSAGDLAREYADMVRQPSYDFTRVLPLVQAALDQRPAPAEPTFEKPADTTAWERSAQ